MVIDMNESQVRRVAGTQALEFRRAEDDEGRYAWIEQVLRRFEYRQLGLADRGAVLAYPQRLSGYSRAQITRARPQRRWLPTHACLHLGHGHPAPSLQGPAPTGRAHPVHRDATGRAQGSEPSADEIAQLAIGELW